MWPHGGALGRREEPGLARWLGDAVRLDALDRARLFDYLAWRTDAGYDPRSNARLMSSLRAFYARQVRLGAMAEDPTALVQRPKARRKLPRTHKLTVSDASIVELA